MEIFEIFGKIVPVMALFTFIRAIFEYRRSQIWKESEFLSKEVKEFLSNITNKDVIKILDWNVIKINFGDGKLIVDDKFIIGSLKTHQEKGLFTEEEAHIREIFDTFFDGLGNFNIHIKNELIEEEKLFNYLGYYLDIIIPSNRKPDEFTQTIFRYLEYYQFKNTRELIEKYKKFKNGK